MKKTLLLLITILTLSGCTKDDEKDTVAILPPQTEKGANTIGCRVDGKAIVPANHKYSSYCFYQYVNGQFYFDLGFDSVDADDNVETITITSSKKQLLQGKTYHLYEYAEGNVSASYSAHSLEAGFTSHNLTGELTITKLDEIQGIISGTFWYDIVDSRGGYHKIRDGRFDFKASK